MDSVVGRGTVLAGRYQLGEPRPCELPGTSEWLATDQILVRPVVVRVFAASGAGAALDAARRAALVSDPRLVRVLDVGSDEGTGYVVTEQVGGPTLGQLVAREPLSADQARAVVGEAASALETARRRGVHHLALRPSTIAVSDDGRVLVSGLALDATLLGHGRGDARSTSRTDATDLVRLVYTALTGHWPGPLATSDGLPTAPETDGVPVPPAELVPGVPADLNTLCAVTLGRDDDGPLSPADLVRELEPWGEIKVAGRARPIVPAAPSTGPTPRTGQVVRQSVRTAFGEPTATANRPGTPPPAGPVLGAGGAATGFPAVASGGAPVVPPAPGADEPFRGSSAPTPALGTPVTPPPAVPPPGAPATPTASFAPGGFAPAVPPPGPLGAGPGGPAAPAFEPAHYTPPEDDPFDFGQVADEPPRRTGMAVAIVVVGLLVVVAIAFAAKALLSHGTSGEPGAVGSSVSQTPTGGPSGSPSSASSPSGSPSPTAASGAKPVVTGITSVDPSDTDGEHQEAVGKAIDGDPATFWFSQTYRNADFSGIKPGVGLVLTLAEPATVSTVTLHVNGTGGAVEVHAGDATDPTKGPALASGSLSSDTVLTLDPATTASSLVVWFTQLPTNAAGQFRIELTEVTLG